MFISCPWPIPMGKLAHIQSVICNNYTFWCWWDISRYEFSHKSRRMWRKNRSPGPSPYLSLFGLWKGVLNSHTAITLVKFYVKQTQCSNLINIFNHKPTMFPRHWSQSEFPPFLGGWSWENNLASGILTAILGNIYWSEKNVIHYMSIISQYMGGEFETSWLYYFLTQSGQSPASEPETQAIMDFLQQHQLHIEVKLCGRYV